MNVRDFIDQYPNCIDDLVWAYTYSFKSGSNYTYNHLKPTPVVITSYSRNGNYIYGNEISRKTMETKKRITLYSYYHVYRTEEECNEGYKAKLQARINDNLEWVEKYYKRNEKLQAVIDSF